LGARLRGPKPETVVGSTKRVLISNVTSSNADMMPSIIAGIEGHAIEDVKFSDVYLEQVGGAGAEMAQIQPPEKSDAYPEPTMFGDLPATGFFVRHAKNVEFSNVEIATKTADPRPAFHFEDVAGADLFRMRFPEGKKSGQFRLKDVSDFRVFGCQHYPDNSMERSTDSRL
jgi:polygalacturonase